MKSTAVHSKTASAGAAGAAITVLVWVLEEVGVNVPPEVAAASVTLASTLAAWVAKARWFNKEG